MSDPNIPPHVKDNDDWHYDGLTYCRLPNVEPLWGVGYYDGIRSFACRYNGRLYHAVLHTYWRDTPFWLYRYKKPWLVYLRHWMFLRYYEPKWWLLGFNQMAFKVSYKIKNCTQDQAAGFWSLPRDMIAPLRNHEYDPLSKRSNTKPR